MNDRCKTVAQRQAIEEEAARLYHKARESGDEADWQEAYGWVAQDPAHGVAFAKAEASWEIADGLRAMPQPMEPEAIAGPAGRFEALFSRRAVAALAASVAAGVVGAVLVEKFTAVERYRTAVGEERHIRLADGSTVHLNTDSAVEVALRKDRRFVNLLKGEARFDVAHDAERPFFVETRDTVMRAVGTSFNVRLRNEFTELTVIEGRVAVRDGAAPPRTVAAGTAATIRGATVSLLRLGTDEIRQRTAWQQGVIQLDGDTLAQAVDEFNRYRRQPLVIGDPELAGLRMGGTFSATSSSEFVNALSQTFGIRSVKDSDGSVILLPAQENAAEDGRKT